jgi:cytochrome c oxidase cbb3-type subunit 3
MRARTGRRALAALVAGVLGGCDRGGPPPPAPAPPGPAPPARLLDVQTSDLRAGGLEPRTGIANPYADDPDARAEGERLFHWMNCAGCHGAKGGGGMGPPLADASWIYGESPAQIYLSVHQGRPNGMPSFGEILPPESIWKIAVYVRSLGGDGQGARGGSVSRDESRRSDGAQ